MRFVKGILFSSAAVLAAASAHAADLPVKAKPVEYVRVCSLYGAGFWYVPGTDTCLKIGSYIREQVEWNAGNGGVPIGFGSNDAAAAGRFDRTDTSQLAFRTRAGISVDLRTQTEYGTLRSYLEGGFQTSSQNGSAPTNDGVYFDRGFIQFAGLTAGRIRSFFDINSLVPYSYGSSRVSGDTGETGLWGIGYTMQFGNGVSFTLSAEDGGSTSQGNNIGQSSSRGRMVSDMNSTAFTLLGATAYDNAGWAVPDLIAALRVDQAWGYAQLSGALRQVAGGYYTGVSSAGGGPGCSSGSCFGHPQDKLGWAVSAGFTLNDVFGWKGDQFGVQAVYTLGAAGYATRATGPFQIYGGNTSLGVGWVTDGVFDNVTPNCPVAGTCPSAIQLTQVWGINAFYQHIWNSKWRTSVYGGYDQVNYNTLATDLINQHLPSPPAGGTACGMPVEGIIQPPLGVGSGLGNSCSPDFSWWQVGTRTQWNPHPDLDIGIDVTWNHLNTAYKGLGNPTALAVVNGVAIPANGAHPTAIATVEDQDVVSVMFRIQRNFLP